MAAVQQRVLNWLYSVLTSEYHDVNRTYADVAQVLSHYSSLTPRTEVYTYENGASALLLQLSGTLPVAFRGATYRFPLALWIPHAYPQEAPIIYVTPTEGMMIRAGQHIDPQGRVYHPYLVAWAQFWDKSNLLDLLVVLRDVFAKEPPVIARRPRVPPSSLPESLTTPPPIPPLPRDIIASPSHASTNEASGASYHPPPPKNHTVAQTQLPGPAYADIRASGPPLPPLPAEISRLNNQRPPSVSSHATEQSASYESFQRSGSKYQTAAPLPPQPTEQQMQRSSTFSHNPSSNIYRPETQARSSTVIRHSSQFYETQAPVNGPKQTPPPYANARQAHLPQSQPWQHAPHPPPSQATSKPPPPPDLLDEPLTGSVPPTSRSSMPAPPIPPNPEKDLLLHRLAQTLHAQRQQSIAQTESSLSGLQAQHSAMLSALSAMQAEISSLDTLSQALASNTSILQSSLVKADKTIEDSQHRTPPAVDEILVAPTVVGNQLYELVAEERALGDALFVLGQAVERGRVTAPAFVKTTRGMAREWFLKKALVKKIGKGMGLDTGSSLGYQP
ncbi:MAG: hypothetical protein M1818_004083 [Claussenomyces sp. TS43310]|nr:MAG: hypothetical protein M1818_004083 [Claussenomyces sp. TS43310]